MSGLVELPTSSGPELVNVRYVSSVHAAEDKRFTVVHLAQGLAGSVLVVILPYAQVRARLLEIQP